MPEYVHQPQSSERTAIAATYRAGEPLDEVLQVAQAADSRAELVEVPAWNVLLVRHTVVPDHSPMYTDYDVVEDGQILVYSRGLDVLYSTDRAGFESEWRPA